MRDSRDRDNSHLFDMHLSIAAVWFRVIVRLVFFLFSSSSPPVPVFHSFGRHREEAASPGSRRRRVRWKSRGRARTAMSPAVAAGVAGRPSRAAPEETAPADADRAPAVPLGRSASKTTTLTKSTSLTVAGAVRPLRAARTSSTPTRLSDAIGAWRRSSGAPVSSSPSSRASRRASLGRR